MITKEEIEDILLSCFNNDDEFNLQNAASAILEIIQPIEEESALFEQMVDNQKKTIQRLRDNHNKMVDKYEAICDDYKNKLSILQK